MVPDGLTLGLVDEPGVTSATPIATAALHRVRMVMLCIQ